MIDVSIVPFCFAQISCSQSLMSFVQFVAVHSELLLAV